MLSRQNNTHWNNFIISKTLIASSNCPPSEAGVIPEILMMKLAVSSHPSCTCIGTHCNPMSTVPGDVYSKIILKRVLLLKSQDKQGKIRTALRDVNFRWTILDTCFSVWLCLLTCTKEKVEKCNFMFAMGPTLEVYRRWWEKPKQLSQFFPSFSWLFQSSLKAWEKPMYKSPTCNLYRWPRWSCNRFVHQKNKQWIS